MTHICVANPSISLIAPGGDPENSVRPRWVNEWAMASWRSHEIGKKKRTYRIKEQIRFAKKLTIEHLFYTISIATNKRIFFKRLWISGHPSSGCDGIRNEFIQAMGYSCQWILSAFGTNGHHHEEVSCIMTSKNRSSMVKETKAKGYKIVSLVWYILLCALCNHTESRIATD